jgi:hypothetical protein
LLGLGDCPNSVWVWIIFGFFARALPTFYFQSQTNLIRYLPVFWGLPQAPFWMGLVFSFIIALPTPDYHFLLMDPFGHDLLLISLIHFQSGSGKG